MKPHVMYAVRLSRPREQLQPMAQLAARFRSNKASGCPDHICFSAGVKVKCRDLFHVV